MPTLADEQIPLAMQLLHAAEATQQALFGGVLATDEETQTLAGDTRLNPPVVDKPELPPQEEGEQPAEVETAGGENQPGRWTGLVGATESQAQEQLTGSLEDVIQQVAAQTQLDQADDSYGPGGSPQQERGEEAEQDTSQAESLATTMPWHAWSQPFLNGGDGLQQERASSSSEGGSEASSPPSHRRRRMHTGTVDVPDPLSV